MDKKSNNRWWEFYGIRYAMGTVFGGLIVLFLFKSSKTFAPLLFLPSVADSLKGSHIVLLAAYGLTYCYLASAPILVLHALRASLWPNRDESDWVDCAIRWSLFLFIPIAIAIGYWYLMPKILAYMWKAGALLMLAFILTVQLVGIVLGFQDGARGLQKFYKKLATARTKKRNAEFVESYRHLREHGNSFFIVAFELALGVILYVLVFANAHVDLPTSAEREVQNLVAILLLWVSPAVGVWAIGQKLERSMLD